MMTDGGGGGGGGAWFSRLRRIELVVELQK